MVADKEWMAAAIHEMHSVAVGQLMARSAVSAPDQRNISREVLQVLAACRPRSHT